MSFWVKEEAHNVGGLLSLFWLAWELPAYGLPVTGQSPAV